MKMYDASSHTSCRSTTLGWSDTWRVGRQECRVGRGEGQRQRWHAVTGGAHERRRAGQRTLEADQLQPTVGQQRRRLPCLTSSAQHTSTSCLEAVRAHRRQDADLLDGHLALVLWVQLVQRLDGHQLPGVQAGAEVGHAVVPRAQHPAGSSRERKGAARGGGARRGTQRRRRRRGGAAAASMSIAAAVCLPTACMPRLLYGCGECRAEADAGAYAGACSATGGGDGGGGGKARLMKR